MGQYGNKEFIAGSNVGNPICLKVKYTTEALSVNDLREEIENNGMDVEKNGNTVHYNSLEEALNDNPKGITIIRKCPKKIGDANLIESTPICKEGVGVFKYECKYNKKSCNEDSSYLLDEPLTCSTFSEFIIGIKDENGKCVYYRTDGKELTVKNKNCIKKHIHNNNNDDNGNKCVWKIIKVGNTFKLVSINVNTGAECANSQILYSANKIGCGQKYTISETPNTIYDSTGNGLHIEIEPKQVSRFPDNSVMKIIVNDNVVLTEPISYLRQHGVYLDVSNYSDYGCYEVYYEIV